MLLAVLVVLWGTGGALSATEVRAGRPEGDLQDGNHLVLVLERLDQLERRFDEERRQWETEKQDWQKEKLEWQKQNEDWQKDKQDWQRQRETLEQLSLEMHSQIISLQHKVDALEAVGNTHRDTRFPTPQVLSQAADSSKTSSEKPSQRRHDHHVLVRSDDVDPLGLVVNQMSQRLSEVAAEVQSLKNVNSQQDQAIQQAGTSTFVRWGRSVCPTSTELVYSGVAGGGWWDEPGSTTTAFCLPLNPVLATQHDKPSEYDWMCGAEYQTNNRHHQKDPVCAVCRTPRPTTIMVPATNVSEDGWTLEYSGYLMGSNPKDPASHEAVCMDTAFENIPGSGANQNGLLFYFMFTYCGSLPCPPYQGNQLVTCAVCSK